MEYNIIGYPKYTIDDDMVVRNYRWGKPKIIKSDPLGGVRLRRFNKEIYKVQVRNLYTKKVLRQAKLRYFSKTLNNKVLK